jgi:hypothetical protein
VDETTRSSYVIQHIEPSSEQLQFAPRHHPLTVVEVKMAQPRLGDKKRQKAATNLSQFVAFGHENLSQFAAICRLLTARRRANRL